MTTDAAVRPRGHRDAFERVALDLLESGGPAAVTSRAVASAAGVQAVAIYRAYGDMNGLLDAAVDRGFETYLKAKVDRPRAADPVEDLRRGWDLHVGFALEHPHVYALMFGRPDVRRGGTAAGRAHAVLVELVEAIARSGRLRTDVASAARAIHAAGSGVALSLIGVAPEERDPALSVRVRDAVIDDLTTTGEEPTGRSRARPEPEDSRARYAAALAATLDDPGSPLTPGEHGLLAELLRRLAGGRA